MRNFRNLTIWTKAIDIAVKAYHLCRFFPREEIYGLRAQITKASVSISANIAEGCSRGSKKDFKRFLEIAIGSSFELESHLVIVEKLGLADADAVRDFITEINSEQRQINSLIDKLGD